MRESGVPWTYRYQYLTGGVNTGRGWATWRRDGSFVTDYLRDSEAMNTIPVFTYYQLLVSAPAAGSDERSRLLSNLRDPQTMAAYFQDFVLLLRRLASTAKPVIVHIEPDLSGYAQQLVLRSDNDASSVPASVASSGHAGLGDLANNYRGYQQALIRLRDQIAPNVVLATHASGWAAGDDIGLATNPNLDVGDIAAKTIRFLNSAGLTELLFVDPSDRDAGFDERINGDGGAHWWDPTDKKYPNFNRYHLYISLLSRQANKPVVLWQVPVGNTVMRSQNNTWNHFQDNRAEYWLGRYPDDGALRTLASAGVIGILFGAGLAGNTSFEDAAGDGITNPSPIGANTQSATVADDDGGYLRQRAAIYYRNPLALPTTPSPQQLAQPTTAPIPPPAPVPSVTTGSPSAITSTPPPLPSPQTTKATVSTATVSTARAPRRRVPIRTKPTSKRGRPTKPTKRR